MLDVTPPENLNVTYMARQSRTLGDMMIRRAQASAGDMAWMIKKDGSWQQTDWRGFLDHSLRFASWLRQRELALGDKICVVGGTRPEWCIADMGGLLAGGVTVGAYPTLSPSQLAYLIDHSDSRFVVVEGQPEVDKLLGIRDDISRVEQVIVWDYSQLSDEARASDWVLPWDTVMAAEPDLEAAEARQQEIDPDETAIIVYTSGTTGPPKGAMISHTNIISLLSEISDFMAVESSDYGMSFLPMAHVAERIAAFYGRINTGMGTAFASSIPAVLEEVVEVRPTVFGSVPRIFEKAYARIMAGVADAPAGKQKIFRWAEQNGREVARLWQAGKPVPLGLRIRFRIADKLVFSKIRGAFGGRVKHFVTGAAPIAHEILEFFWASGFPIYEVYGMTEATVLTHANRPGEVKLGTVGKAMPYAEARLAEDNEILIRGSIVFKGYYKNPEATAEAIDSDGWLHTGDIGRLDDDGFLSIVDRKKHIIITAGGKNLTPANIENEIKTQDPLISQVHVHGDKRPYLTAIITIHPVEAIEYALKHQLITDTGAAQAMVTQLMENPLAVPDGLEPIMANVTSQDSVRQRLVQAVKNGNVNLSRVETIKKIHILSRDFSVEEDEITPTLKVKRKNVEQKYLDIFDRIYNDEGFGLVVEGK